MFPLPSRLWQRHNAKVGKPRQFSALQIRPIPVDKQGRPETQMRGRHAEHRARIPRHAFTRYTLPPCTSDASAFPEPRLEGDSTDKACPDHSKQSTLLTFADAVPRLPDFSPRRPFPPPLSASFPLLPCLPEHGSQILGILTIKIFDHQSVLGAILNCLQNPEGQRAVLPGKCAGLRAPPHEAPCPRRRRPHRGPNTARSVSPSLLPPPWTSQQIKRKSGGRGPRKEGHSPYFPAIVVSADSSRTLSPTPCHFRERCAGSNVPSSTPAT